MRCFLIGLFTVALFHSQAVWPQSDPILLGRSGPSDGFLIPGNTGFSNNNVSLNAAGEAALRLSSVGTSGNRAIWFGDGVVGRGRQARGGCVRRWLVGRLTRIANLRCEGVAVHD